MRVRPRLAVLVASAVLILAVAVVVWPRLTGQGGTTEEAPSAYVATYTVTDLLSDPVVEGTWVLAVQRPYRSRLTQTRDEVEVADQIGGIDALLMSRADGGYLRQPWLPGVAAADLRLDVTLEEGIDAGRLGTDGRGTFLGRDCRWVTSDQPLDAGRWAPPHDGDITRTCVDGAGLLLAEEIAYGGVEARRREVVELQVGDDAGVEEALAAPGADGEDAEVGEATDVPALGLAEVALLEELPDVALALEAPAPPEGFTADLIVGYREGDPTRGAALTALGRRLTFIRGPDVVVLDERRDMSGTPADLPQEETVDSAVLGTLSVAQDGRGVSLSAQVSDVLVTVRGTVPLADLLAWIDDAFALEDG